MSQFVERFHAHIGKQSFMDFPVNQCKGEKCKCQFTKIKRREPGTHLFDMLTGQERKDRR